MKKLWNKIIFQIKRVPWYGWVAGVFMLLLNTLLYFLTNVIVKNWSNVWAFMPKIDVIDNGIPFVGYFFVEIYFFSYLFWIFGPIVASVSKKDKFLNYMFGLLAAYIIGYVILVFAPSYLDRVKEGLVCSDGSLGPKIAGMKDGLSKFLFKVLFFFDGGTRGTNLFPSFHCLISLFCWLGITRNKDISLGSRIYAFSMAMLISLSTLFIKQHYFVDIPCGHIMAIGCFYLMLLIKPGEKLLKKYPSLFVIKKKPNRNFGKTKRK